MNANAPILIFAYRRPNHLKQMLESLVKCEGFDSSNVIVHCDGPRNASEVATVEITRKVALSMLGDRAEYHFKERNLGLSRSVINGVGAAVKKYGRVIVLEDDLVLSTSFLTFMNRALDRYADAVNVYQVAGYMYDIPRLQDRGGAVFLPFTSSWGWATWKRAWEQFDPIAAGWEVLRTDKALRKRFNLEGNYEYATMLERQMLGRSDSWAIRWYWSVFKANGIVLFPPFSLVSNIGLDGSGTHGRGVLRRFRDQKERHGGEGIVMPDSLCVDDGYYSHVKKALWNVNGGCVGSAIDFIRGMFVKR